MMLPACVLFFHQCPTTMQLLDDELKGSVHALSLVTKTPQEAQDL